MCVCALHCAQLLHNTAHNRADNFPSYSPDNHHCSDDVYLREGGDRKEETERIWPVKNLHKLFPRIVVFKQWIKKIKQQRSPG